MKLEEYLKERYTPQIAANYLTTIQAYTRHRKGAQKAVYSDVVSYVGDLRTRYSNAHTIRKALSAIKAYYGWLCITGRRTDNPAKAVRLKDKQSKDIQLQDLLSEAELEGLLARIVSRGLLGIRNEVMMGLLVYQALQPKEMESIQVTDIDLAAGQLYVRPTLVSHGRTLQLRAPQVMLLHQYLNDIRPQLLGETEIKTEILLLSERGNPMLKMDISKQVKRHYRCLYGRRAVNCKTIRQSVITNLLKKGTDVRIVQVFAGHKSTGTTGRYRQTDVDALKAAVVKYHPFA